MLHGNRTPVQDTLAGDIARIDTGLMNVRNSVNTVLGNPAPGTKFHEDDRSLLQSAGEVVDELIPHVRAMGDDASRELAAADDQHALRQCIDGLVVAAGRVAVAQAEVDAMTRELAEVDQQLADAIDAEYGDDRIDLWTDNAEEVDLFVAMQLAANNPDLRVFRIVMSGMTTYEAAVSTTGAYHSLIARGWQDDGGDLEITLFTGDAVLVAA